MEGALAVVSKPIGLLYKKLISDDLWERLVGRVVSDQGLSREGAEQAIDAGLGFLKLCADNPGQMFSPSHAADVGWHTFLMYTRSYQRFCEEHAGRFIHHEPNDVPGVEPLRGGVQSTVEFMMSNGIPFNPDMWPIEGGKCTTDDCRDDCHWCSKFDDTDGT